MQLSLKQKIIGLAVLAAILPVTVLLILTVFQKKALHADVSEELRFVADAEAEKTARMVYLMCEMSHQRTQRQLQDFLAGASNRLASLGAITLAPETVTWQARNQISQETMTVALPKMMAGTNWLGQNDNFAIPSPVVDEVTQSMRGYCTIFQRINPQGDMIRICTSVPTRDGKRAIGTFIPHQDADGQSNAVIAAVLKGQTYFGRAFVVDTWHAAAYEPIWDSPDKKEVIGMLYVGFDQKIINQELRQTILSIKIGKTGYVCILGAKGEQRGCYIISKDGLTDGSNLWSKTDSNGRLFIQDQNARAIAAPPGTVIFDRYPWINPGESVPRSKTTAIMYFQPWEWLIYSGLYDDDFQAVLDEATASITRLLSVSIISGILVLLAAIGLALCLGTTIARPISHIVQVTQLIAQGNLAEARKAMASRLPQCAARAGDAPPKDETGQLLAAINQMTQNLTALVGQVQHSSVQLVSTATEIAATSRQQESTVTNLGASSTEITAAVKEISATSQELAKTMEDVKNVAEGTENLADKGRSSLTGMEGSMRQLANATASISAKLAVISEKTNNINKMVTTITKVADQTNLLSLNASIEAEKAGEYGQGFAVVAREIRRLADQTAVATLEIEQTVKEMQSSVSAGVMEMDKFTGEVTQGVQAVAEISRQLGQIIAQVKVLAPRFDTVNEGMRAQSAGAQQISEAMAQLSESARHTAESLKQFNLATEQLKEATQGLKTEVNRFKV